MSVVLDTLEEIRQLTEEMQFAVNDDDLAHMRAKIGALTEKLLRSGGGLMRLIDSMKVKIAACKAEADYYTEQAKGMKTRAGALENAIKFILEERLRPIIQETGKPIEIDMRRIQLVNCATQYKVPDWQEIGVGVEVGPSLEPYVQHRRPVVDWARMQARMAELKKLLDALPADKIEPGSFQEQQRKTLESEWKELMVYVKPVQSNYVRIC